MKVSRILHFFDQFKKYLSEGGEPTYSFIYETVDHWSNHWNVYSDDLAISFDRCLQNRTTARLWGGSRDSAKSIMMEMIKMNPEMMKHAFVDLFSHEKDIGLRIGRFIHYCDDILEEIRKNTNLINAHYQDKAMVSLYLTLEKPQFYALFDYDIFERFMIKVESLKVPTEHETDRYYKSLRGIMNLYKKDEELVKLYQNRVGTKISEPLIFMNDFMEFVVRSK